MQKSGDALLECLVIFTKRYHKPMNIESLIAGLPIEEGAGTPKLFSASNSKSLFSRAAKKAGLLSRLVQEDIEHLDNLLLPAILMLKNEKACILERIDHQKGKAYIIVPEADDMQTVVSLEDLAQSYLGYMFLLKKAYRYKSLSYKRLARRDSHWFWGTVHLSKTIYRDVIIASLIINLFLIASPLFVMNVYDRVVPNSAIETLWVLAAGIFVIYLIDLVVKNIRSYFLEIAAKKSDVIISSRIFEKVLDIKMSARPASTGSFSSHLRDFDAIRNFLTSTTLTAVIDIPFALIFLFTIWLLSGFMVLIPVAVIGIILSYVSIINRPLQRSIEMTHEATANRNAILIESLYNIETIKAMGTAGHTQWHWEEASGEIAQKGLRSKVLAGSIPSVIQFFIQTTILAILIVGVYQIDAKEMTMGALIATVMLTSRALAPVGQIASLTTNYQNTKTAFEQLEEIMDLEQEHPEGKEFVQRDRLDGTIEFRGVNFTYDPEGVQTLHDISFKIEPSEKVAIIGRIGSGKTTVEKLLLGLYECDSGGVYFDDIDIKQLDRATIRKSIGYVSQDITLFSGTLKENIVYKYPHADDESIIKAAKLSGIDEFVNQHPKGYEMPIGEQGIGLSGGQRQSIAIARAVLVDAPILLLDEPTNMMDSTSEKRLIQNLKAYLQTRTAIIVTHKTSLLDLADRIIVMDQGRIVMDGPKTEILKKIRGSEHG